MTLPVTSSPQAFLGVTFTEKVISLSLSNTGSGLYIGELTVESTKLPEPPLIVHWIVPAFWIFE